MTPSIVWIGDIGFPVGMAPVKKTYLICKALVEQGARVTVISRKGPHSPGTPLDISKRGQIDEIEYVYASGTPYRPDNPINRTALKFRGLVNEIKILRTMKKGGVLDAAILQTDKFSAILFYRILSKMLQFPLILAYVELYSSIASRTGIVKSVNDYLYERLGFRLLDGAMPISDFLCDFVRSRNPALPLLKVPMITDFQRFDGIEKTATEKYFLFCGSARYIEIISYIINAFESMPETDRTHLYLVSSGTDTEIKKLNDAIDRCSKNGRIHVFSQVTDEHLSHLYKNAIGLLLPLRPTIQDTARFPHKLGEYLASGNPVITTNYGEIKKYFADQESALIAERYSIDDFSTKMQFVVSNPESATRVGAMGRSVGKRYFDYKDHGPKIIEFIESIRY